MAIGHTTALDHQTLRKQQRSGPRRLARTPRPVLASATAGLLAGKVFRLETIVAPAPKGSKQPYWKANVVLPALATPDGLPEGGDALLSWQRRREQALVHKAVGGRVVALARVVLFMHGFTQGPTAYARMLHELAYGANVLVLAPCPPFASTPEAQQKAMVDAALFWLELADRNALPGITLVGRLQRGALGHSVGGGLLPYVADAAAARGQPLACAHALAPQVTQVVSQYGYSTAKGGALLRGVRTRWCVQYGQLDPLSPVRSVQPFADWLPYDSTRVSYRLGTHVGFQDQLVMGSASLATRVLPLVLQVLVGMLSMWLPEQGLAVLSELQGHGMAAAGPRAHPPAPTPAASRLEARELAVAGRGRAARGASASVQAHAHALAGGGGERKRALGAAVTVLTRERAGHDAPAAHAGATVHMGAAAYDGAAVHAGAAVHTGAAAHAGTTAHPGAAVRFGAAVHTGAAAHAGAAAHPGAAVRFGAAVHTGAAAHAGATAHPGAAVRFGAAVHTGAAAHAGAAAHPGTAVHPGAAAHTGAAVRLGDVRGALGPPDDVELPDDRAIMLGCTAFAAAATALLRAIPDISPGSWPWHPWTGWLPVTLSAARGALFIAAAVAWPAAVLYPYQAYVQRPRVRREVVDFFNREL